MSNYIEEYKLQTGDWGIEDFRSPGKHFFDGINPNSRKPMPRYHLWRSGCGCGQANTLDVARYRLLDLALDRTNTEIQKVNRLLDSLMKDRTKLEKLLEKL